MPRTKVGYHLNPIPKGKLGEISKIQEELDELKDADQQGCKIMALLELSDMLGAVELYLEKHHPGMKIQDLLTMSEITQRAWVSGHRK